jgi:hypothetical protein
MFTEDPKPVSLKDVVIAILVVMTVLIVLCIATGMPGVPQ